METLPVDDGLAAAIECDRRDNEILRVVLAATGKSNVTRERAPRPEAGGGAWW
jgi:hypothetical protein